MFLSAFAILKFSSVAWREIVVVVAVGHIYPPVTGQRQTLNIERSKDKTTSGGSRKFWWGGIWSTKPQKFGCLHQNWDWFFGRNRKFKRFFRPKSGGLQKKKVFTKIETDFPPVNVFFAQNQVVSKKKKKKKKKGLYQNWDWFFGRIRYV